VPIEPVDEPLVPVGGGGGAVRQEPLLHAARLPGAGVGLWVREGVAERLAAAAGALPPGLTLVVWDAHRPMRAQAALYDGDLTELVLVHPEWPGDALEDVVDRAVDRPVHAPCPPLHVTGGAVDVTLGDGDGRPLDLGLRWDPVAPGRDPSLEREDTPARDLRRTLFWAMAGAGFTAHPDEPWHFDHGDQLWGLVCGRPARYGPVERPD
jgi:D-alanyl-D-alanine dipeptidase